MKNLRSLKNFEDVANVLGITKEQLKSIIVYNKKKIILSLKFQKKMDLKEKFIDLRIH